MKNFIDDEFVILDVETTGLSAAGGDRIIELAALKIKGLQTATQFHSFINPEREISPEAFAVNGINAEMLADAATAQEILPDFFEFLGEDIVVGHNIKFDLGFLLQEASRARLSWGDNIPTICTVKMARALLPEIARYPLWLVAQTLGIETAQEHRALSDVHLTWAVFRRLLDRANRRDITDSQMLVRLFDPQKKPDSKQEHEIKKSISVIEEAIEFKKTILISYFSAAQGAVTFRKVNPQKIVKEKGQMKLVGFCQLRGEARSFRLDRILRLTAE